MDRQRFEQFVTVTAEDIDDLGHVNNAVYLRYAEACGRAHSDSLGLTLAAFRALGAIPVIRRHEIQYLKPAYQGDRLRVTTEVTKLGGPRAQRHNRIYRTGSEELLVEVLTDWVWLGPASLRPVRVPAPVIAAFEGRPL